MNSASVRLNITLPADLARRLDAEIGPRKKSRFIAEVVTERLARLNQERLERDMEDGYKARAAENRALTKDFEPVDT